MGEQRPGDGASGVLDTGEPCVSGRAVDVAALPVLERWMREGLWPRGTAGARGEPGSFTLSMAMSTLESSCRGMLSSSEEKGLGGFSRHISQLVLPAATGRGSR